MFKGDSQIGENSLPKSQVKTREVLVPVFLKVSVPETEDDMHAECLAGDVVRSIRPMKGQGGVIIAVVSLISPICK